MKIHLSSTVRHDGIDYPSGSVLDMADSYARELIEAGVASRVVETKAPDAVKVPDAPQAPAEQKPEQEVK